MEEIRAEYHATHTVPAYRVRAAPFRESAGVEFAADYRERVSFDVRVPVVDAPALRDRVRSATSGRAEIDS